MGFDLYVWPINRPVSHDEATAELERLTDYDQPGEPVDQRLRTFVAQLRERFPAGFVDDDAADGAQPPAGAVVFELDESKEHVFLGIPWPFVADVGAAAQEIAFANDLMLFDPQSSTAIVSPRFGGEPVDWAAPDEATVEALSAQMEAEMDVDVSDLELDDPGDALRSIIRSIGAAGGTVTVPMGFELTEDMVDDVFGDPGRLPSRLQTPDTKARLLTELRSPKNRPRREAVTQLAGWDADEEVDRALGAALESGDEFVRWMAASGLARHGHVAALDDVLAATRRASPAGEGDVGRMLMPAQAALELAAKAGPTELERARSLITEWRGPRPSKPRPGDRELDAILAADY